MRSLQPVREVAEEVRPLGALAAVIRQGEGEEKDADGDRRRGDEDEAPARAVDEREERAAADDERDAVGGHADGVDRAEELLRRRADREGVDGDVLRRRGDRQRRHDDVEERPDARAHRRHRHQRERDRRERAGNPAAIAAESVDERRPEELQCPRQRHGADEADGGELDVVEAQEGRDELAHDAVRQPFREVEHGCDGAEEERRARALQRRGPCSF